MELWEFNAYIIASEDRQKLDAANAIMTGYYCAYYTNGGKKAKSPKELIQNLYKKKQSFEDGIKDIEKIKELEKLQGR